MDSSIGLAAYIQPECTEDLFSDLFIEVAFCCFRLPGLGDDHPTAFAAQVPLIEMALAVEVSILDIVFPWIEEVTFHRIKVMMVGEHLAKVIHTHVFELPMEVLPFGIQHGVSF